MPSVLAKISTKLHFSSLKNRYTQSSLWECKVFRKRFNTVKILGNTKFQTYLERNWVCGTRIPRALSALEQLDQVTHLGLNLAYKVFHQNLSHVSYLWSAELALWDEPNARLRGQT